MKIQTISHTISPFGGINFLIDAFGKFGINKLVNQQLGKRAPNAQYNHADIFSAMWSIVFCGGDCPEDINEHLRDTLRAHPGMKVPSADVLLSGIKNLSTPVSTHISKQGITHEFNHNEKMSDLHLQLLKHLHLLEDGVAYDLDYDNQVIPTEKYDAKRTYKQCDGYQPGIASIGDLPVYAEMRNGNSPAKYLQHETLARIFSHLEKHSIKVGKVRMDSASYQKEVIELVEKHSEKFYIRAMRCDYMFDLMGQLSDWKKTTIGVKEYEVTSTEYTPFGDEKIYRLVLSREMKDDAQSNLFTKDNCVYRGILTDDYLSTPVEVLQFYNQRGAGEKIFDVMNNDFCWNRLPFSFMNQNLVFMIVMMMCRAIYKWALRMWCKKIDFIQENFRLKKFIFRFINVAGKWIKRGRQNILKLFTDKKYELII